MPGTVDDFISRFGGKGSIDDRQAEQYYDRFASTRDEDRDFNNDALYDGASQHLGRLDDDEFTRVSEQAYRQAPPEQRSGFLQTILRGIQGKGADLGRIGVQHTDPREMTPEEYARVTNYARRQHPEVMREA